MSHPGLLVRVTVDRGNTGSGEDSVQRAPTDEELLTSDDPDGFGEFYARHLSAVEAYFARRVGRDAAADLAAETFASALIARRRFVPGNAPALGRLYTIAARRLVDYQRRGLVRARTLDALAGEVRVRDHAAPSPGDPGRARCRPFAPPATRSARCDHRACHRRA